MLPLTPRATRFLLVVGAVLLSAAPADARPPYKKALADFLGLPNSSKLNDCRTCHLPDAPDRKDTDPKPLLLDVLHKLGEGTRPELASDRLDHVFATMACHSVVRAGDVLGRQQAMALLSQLDAVDLRSHCPHGRPVLLRLPMSEIERRFGRV